MKPLVAASWSIAASLGFTALPGSLFTVRAQSISAAATATTSTDTAAPAPDRTRTEAAGTGDRAELEQGRAAAAASPDITVTAQRRSQRIRDVPATVLLRTGKQLEDAGVTNTAELAQVLPGFSFTYNGGFAQPSLRGISTTVTTPGSDNPIAIYLDGVYQAGEIGNTFELPDVERVETLKGPQGTLFGRNATGGAIQISTRQPSSTPTGLVTVTAGLFDGSGASRAAANIGVKAFVSGPLTDTVAASLSGLYKRNQGYFSDTITGGRWGKATSRLVRGKVRWEASDLTLTLSGYYSKRNDDSGTSIAAIGGLSAGAAYPGAILAAGPWRLAFDTEPRLAVRAWSTSLVAVYERAFGTFTSTSSYTDLKIDTKVDVDASYSPNCLLARACSDLFVGTPERYFSQELIFSSKRLGPFKFVAGLNAFIAKSAQLQRFNDFTTPLPRAPIVVNTGPTAQSTTVTRTRAYAAFGEVDASLSDQLVLTVGGRYSIERKTGYGAVRCCETSGLPKFIARTWRDFTPRIALKYDVTSRSSIYASYSRGFKSGVLPFFSLVTAPAANPERVTAYETGFKTARSGFTLNTAAFYYDYQDLQVQINTSSSPIINNAAKAQIFGFDVDGSVRISDTLRLSGGMSYLARARFVKYPSATSFGPPLTAAGLTRYTRNIAGQVLFRTPKMTANLAADFTTSPSGDDELAANINLYYSSRIFYEPEHIVTTDPYAILAARLTYSPPRSNVTFSLYGKNLTGKAYVSRALRGPAALASNYGPPRELGMSVDYSF